MKTMKSIRAVCASSCLSGLMLACASPSAQAQIMKCVGKDGKIEFATNCPTGTQQQTTGVASKPATAPAAKTDGKSDSKAGAKDAGQDKAAPKSLADREADFRKRQTEQKEADTKSTQAATETAERQRSCQAAQANLAALQNRQRTVQIDPKTGQRAFYEEADFLRELPITERRVAENCKL